MHQALLRRSRVMAAVAVTAVPLSLLAVVAPSANAANPDGSNYELFLEQGSLTGQPANKILGGGFWGHEGAGRDQATIVSADLGADGSGAALLSAFGTDDLGKLALAFTTSSADGSTEEPAIPAGANLAQAYPWFTEIGFGTSFAGTAQPATDEVLKVSTAAEYQAWINDGKPDQLISSADLISRDPLRGNIVSVAPKGKSILNRWASGQKISLVIVKTTGKTDANGIPIVDRDASGHAVAAWLKFTTGLDPAVGTGANAGKIATSGKYTFVVDAVNTSTTLSVTPDAADPAQVEGTPVTLKATVAQAKGADKPTGTVQFKDGATNVGAPVAVTNGVATLVTSDLAVGSHSLTAEFIPADGTFNGSTSAASTYSVVATPAVGTTTAVAVTPGTSTAFEDVTLTATVTANKGTKVPAGSVQFKEGAVNIGSPVATDAQGVATLKTNALGAGDHTVTAVFTPTDSAKFTASTNTSSTFNLKAPVVTAQTVGNIEAKIEAGTITLSTPYSSENPLSFGSLALDGNAASYVGSKDFAGITVTDTRAGAQPWTLNASASDLVSGSNKINAQNVGLTNLVKTSTTGLGTISTFDNPAANAVAPTASGSLGLAGKAKPVLASTAGPGTVVYKGTLTIKAPTSTQAGLYTGTVTFTVS